MSQQILATECQQPKFSIGHHSLCEWLCCDIRGHQVLKQNNQFTQGQTIEKCLFNPELVHLHVKFCAAHAQCFDKCGIVEPLKQVVDTIMWDWTVVV